MSHRLITTDGADRCFVCGAEFADGADPSAADCISENPHPPVYVGPHLETCAAHPYDCDGPIIDLFDPRLQQETHQ